MKTTAQILALARRALPLMSAEARAEVGTIVAELERTANAAPGTLAEFSARAAAAFESDMKPVVTALASALHANDLGALKGLQALLPGLLREVNAAPALADLLALQLGTAFLAGLTEGQNLQNGQNSGKNSAAAHSVNSVQKSGEDAA